MINKEKQEDIVQLNNLVKKLNQENMELKSSNVYKKGKNISILLAAIKNFKFNEILNLIKLRNKLKKCEKFCEATPCLYDIKENSKLVENTRIAVYTCIIGNYDKIYRPQYIPNNCDFFIITDQEVQADLDIKFINPNKFNISNLDSISCNRYFKMNPQVVFPDYDYSVYIDGNIEVYSDLTELVNKIPESGIGFYAHSKRNCIYKEYEVCRLLGKGNAKKIYKQIEKYKKDGFPKGFGMVEANVIAREHNNSTCKKIMELWWKEYSIWGERDQISLPYVLWKSGMRIEEVISLGADVHHNFMMRIHSHKRR